MDGARFANALVSLGCTPAEATWKSGVDVLSFGATKNGALAAEAVIFFDRTRREFEYPAQEVRPSLVQDALPFGPARRLSDRRALAEACAPRQRHGQAPGRGPGKHAGYQSRPPGGSQRGVRRPARDGDPGAEANSFRFYRWLGEDKTRLRLVTAFNTRPVNIEAFIASARRHAAKANERVA